MSQYVLIDDNPTFSRLLQRSMQRLGHTLICCHTTEEALQLKEAGDGIILDLNLGAESGLKLLPILHAQFPNTPILILTGYASINTAVSAIKLGACEYLPKPVDVETILNCFIQPNKDENLLIETPLEADPLSLKRLTWEHLQRVLEENHGNISATARALNMHRRTLQRMLQKHPVKK
ncbi:MULTISPECIES: response regulator transcription factor [Vitreoscilla]|uniref:Response regulator n=1 Tax=Vitreoscilla stercoraria TaxID=61 RepID=A0ABY4ED70_VITST|nr:MULTISPECIES: response regulator [Vitreoscilla]AUZ04983.1 signal transduction response regulator [Vitreoscilla sp. C1]UOO91377.1 response regulator [Vitreoscilla stercoraria]